MEEGGGGGGASLPRARSAEAFAFGDPHLVALVFALVTMVSRSFC